MALPTSSRIRTPNGAGQSQVPEEPRAGRAPSVIICGAGPAGLTAAYELTKHGMPAQVLEADPRYVGGISRTVQYRGYRFDIGGHRFFSKSLEIERLWDELLGEELLSRDRLSRIFYRGKFYHYPIRVANAMWNLGPAEALMCCFSYLRARLRPDPHPVTFEQWVINQFGARLFRTFFKTYTEKVWGISTKQLSADWAAQRIRGLSFSTLIANSLPRGRMRGRSNTPKTLVDHFRYPRLGPGQCWEAAAEILRASGQPVAMGERVVALHAGHENKMFVVSQNAAGALKTWPADSIVSTLPLRELVRALRPAPPAEILEAASKLNYRDFLTVGVVVARPHLFADNWIYIHDPGVKVGRIQNFKNWSPDMSPDSAHTHLGLEYFCFEGDDLWASSDQTLVALAGKELQTLGLCRAEEVIDGLVIRCPKAYPVYDSQYAEHVATIRTWLAVHYPNLWCVGRNGMHKYNNQDHSMMTALLAARSILGISSLDPWCVNSDAEYHEAEGHSRVTERLAPLPLG